MAKLSAQEIRNGLLNFTGTEHYYKYLLGFKLTDGAKFIADSCGAYWLMDIIASYKHLPEVAKEQFQVYTLMVKNGIRMVTVEDGDDNVLHMQAIPNTDFPLEEIIIWMVDDVIMLPGEY